ncbi:MAG: DNA-processing protein DprA, partial [Gammaproteobacteria bacterium]
RRNRIISGLALGTLVVEAALRSGSLITARLASEQGREVFAIPGSIHNPLARGCHRLIREGAKLVESASDILEELGPLAGVVFASPDQDARPTRRPATEEGNDPEKEALLKCVGHEPTSIDTIVERAGLSADVVSSMLLILELQGQVAATPGGRYTRVN